MFQLPEGRPALMGILNITPDSFSDGGVNFDPQVAIESGWQMMEDGADLLDVGGESTRPGSEGVSLEEELKRVMPVVGALAAQGFPVSIDTAKAAVAREALAAGAVVVNDVTAFGDLEMADVCREFGCTVCLMHMKGTPRTMQIEPRYDDVVEEVRSFLVQRAEQLSISADRIWIDPGIGFGKTVQHNLKLLQRLDRFVDTGYPVLVGTSRKSFIGKLLGHGDLLPANDRVEGTLATHAWAQMKGARIIRAHDVRESRRAIDMVAAIQQA